MRRIYSLVVFHLHIQFVDSSEYFAIFLLKVVKACRGYADCICAAHGCRTWTPVFKYQLMLYPELLAICVPKIKIRLIFALTQYNKG